MSLEDLSHALRISNADAIAKFRDPRVTSWFAEIWGERLFGYRKHSSSNHPGSDAAINLGTMGRFDIGVRCFYGSTIKFQKSKFIGSGRTATADDLIASIESVERYVLVDLRRFPLMRFVPLDSKSLLRLIRDGKLTVSGISPKRFDAWLMEAFDVTTVRLELSALNANAAAAPHRKPPERNDGGSLGVDATPALPLLCVIVPVHNEAGCLAECDKRLHDVLGAMPIRFEILYVDDGSTDGSRSQLHALRAQSVHVGVLELSRNFGKEVALSAGLDHVTGDAIVLIDADLQDPPELIPALFEKWREGFDNVYAQRLSRGGENWLKRLTAFAFYRLLNRLTQHPVPLDAGDFRLLSRRAANALRQIRERHRFMKGLYGWVGFSQIGVPYHRAARSAGKSSWNYWQLWNFSLEGITSFSTLPLQMTSYLGFGIAVLSVLYGSFLLIRTLMFGNPVAGYPSLIVIVLFLGGVQMLSIGIIGEYLGRLFNEVKGRPLYLTAAHMPSGGDRGGSSDPPYEQS